MSQFITPMQKVEFGYKHSTNPQPTQISDLPFQNILADAFNETIAANDISNQDTQDLILGNVDNIAQVQINSLKTQTMLQTTVQLTSRVVNAYKEILQMQI